MDIQSEKIAICIPTFLKDDTLMETINSILDIYQDNWIILIADQNREKDWSFEKSMFYQSACAEAHMSLKNQDRIKVIRLPYNCGLSYARNKLTETANNLDIKYCLMTADSIKFTESMKNINYLLKYLKYSPDFDIDLLGFDIKGRVGWEAWLDLKESFELDFIETIPIKSLFDKYAENSFTIWKCDIVRNFFLATTKSLLDVQWDNNGKMSEHTPFFWEYKKEGYKVGWTDKCIGEYLKNDDNTYRSLRRGNMTEGKKYFIEKYRLKRWIKYINFQNIKR